jgi:anti-sigma factor RsiW
LQQGYTIVAWNDAGLAYWAVSNTSAEDMQAFARIARQPPQSATTEPSAPANPR